MNERKEGRPYRFPESYVSFLAFLNQGGLRHDVQGGAGGDEGPLGTHKATGGDALHPRQAEDHGSPLRRSSWCGGWATNGGRR